MAKAPRPWIVTPHGPLEKLDDNLWALRSALPGLPRTAGFDRVMHIVRLADGRLVFHNAVPMDEPTLAELRAWGKPALLLVPHHLHAMDAHAFREKLGLQVYTGPVSVDKVRRILPVDGTFDQLPKMDELRAFPLGGTKFGEFAFILQTGPRASVLFCDAVHNNARGSGFHGFMFNLMGFAGTAPKVPPFYKLRAVSDRAQLKADLLKLAATPGLQRLVFSHGAVVSQDAPGALRAAAEAGL